MCVLNVCWANQMMHCLEDFQAMTILSLFHLLGQSRRKQERNTESETYSPWCRAWSGEDVCACTGCELVVLENEEIVSYMLQMRCSSSFSQYVWKEEHEDERQVKCLKNGLWNRKGSWAVCVRDESGEDGLKANNAWVAQEMIGEHQIQHQ